MSSPTYNSTRASIVPFEIELWEWYVYYPAKEHACSVPYFHDEIDFDTGRTSRIKSSAVEVGGLFDSSADCVKAGGEVITREIERKKWERATIGLSTVWAFCFIGVMIAFAVMLVPPRVSKRAP